MPIFRLISNIWRKTRKLNALILDREIYYDLFVEHEQLLETGTYYLFFDGVRYVWKKADKHNWLISIRKYTFKNIIKILVLKNRANACSSSEKASGNEMIISRRKTSVKIIDYKEQRLISVYFQNEELSTVQSFQDTYVCYFGTSTIRAINEKQKMVIETLIQDKEAWKEDVETRDKCIKWFMGGLLRYCSNAPVAYYINTMDIIKSIDSTPLSNETERNDKKEVLESIFHEIRSFADKELPFINAHCDLSFFNILYDGEIFYLIDCEYFHPNLFFFDALYWLSYEAMVNHDYSYFDHYFAGSYDQWLAPIFDRFGWQYRAAARKTYIYLLLLAELSMHLSYSEMGVVRSYESFKEVMDYLKKVD